MRMGQRIALDQTFSSDEIAALDGAGELVGILRRRGELWKPEIVMSSRGQQRMKSQQLRRRNVAAQCSGFRGLRRAAPRTPSTDRTTSCASRPSSERRPVSSPSIPIRHWSWLRRTRRELIGTLDQRLEGLERLGVEQVGVLDFNEFAARECAASFVERVLVGDLGTTDLVVGDDVHFGRDREGDIALLVREGERHGFRVHTSPTYGAASAL